MLRIAAMTSVATALAVLAVGALPAAGADAPTCLNLKTSGPENPTAGLTAATIVGTPGDDVIRGTDGDDVIVGLGVRRESFLWAVSGWRRRDLRPRRR